MDPLKLSHLPWDAHLHLRDGAVLKSVAPAAARNCWGAIIMPNLMPPVTTGAEAIAYRERIMSAMGDADFRPSMTLYLTDDTDPDEVVRAFEAGEIVAVKKYPLHGTTNSARAVTELTRVYPVLRRMEECGIPLLIHGEQPLLGSEPANPLKREPLYLSHELQEILDRFPQLRVSLEHISTKEAAEFIRQHGSPDRVATITPQHLVSHIGRAMYTTDGAYMPCAKDIEDMLALQKLIAEGCPWVHLGTDGAPHVEEAKCAVQCACGAFTPHAPELYLEAFTQAGCLEYFEEFACLRGPRFFGLDPKPGTMVFQRQKWQFDEFFTVPETGELIRPFGFRTCEEEDRHLGVNRTMTWRRQT